MSEGGTDVRVAVVGMGIGRAHLRLRGARIGCRRNGRRGRGDDGVRSRRVRFVPRFQHDGGLADLGDHAFEAIDIGVPLVAHFACP